MSDRNYPAYSEGFYEEINAEMAVLKKNRNKNNIPDIEIIRVHLQNMGAAFKLYSDLIETVLKRLEAK